jgi:hypothetical protein
VPTDRSEASFLPTAPSLVSNGPNGVLAWTLDPAEQFEAACRLAGRDLTAAEWSTYFPGESPTATCAAVLD